MILPNTSGARTAEEAIRLARLARAMGCGNWIKIEVINDQKYLLPDNFETLNATEALAKEGFVVLPYMAPDLAAARRMVDAGAAAVMPLGAPIGSNRGLKTLELIEILVGRLQVPVIVDAGIGRPSHAAAAMEIGVAAILLNTAIATADDPVAMAARIPAGRRGRESSLSGRSRARHRKPPGRRRRSRDFWKKTLWRAVLSKLNRARKPPVIHRFIERNIETLISTMSFIHVIHIKILTSPDMRSNP